MPLTVTCKCGKSLKARDELAGRAVRCPDCGKPLRVPGGAKTPEPVRSPKNESPGAAPPRPRKKKKKSKHRRSRGPSIQILPADVSWTMVIMLLLLIGGVSYGVYFFTRPVQPYYITQVKTVDAYTALRGIRYRLPLVPGGEGKYTFGGNSRLIITHDNPQGDHLLVHLKINQKYLRDNGVIMKSSLDLGHSQIALIIGEEKIHPMILIGKGVEGENQVAISRSLLGIQQFDPTADLRGAEPTDPTEEPKEYVPPPPVVFNSPGGMEVTTTETEDQVLVRWDAQSTSYTGNKMFQGTESGIFEKSWEIECLFPKHGPGAKLQVFDGPQLEIDVR